MRKLGVTGIIVGLVVCGSIVFTLGVDVSTPGLLREGQYQEQTLEDAAMDLYREVLQREHATSDQKADARLHLARCLENLGRLDEAKAQLRELAEDFSKGEAATEASAKLSVLTAADPAKLMPANSIAYVEVLRPGEQMERLHQLFTAAGFEHPLQTLLQDVQAGTSTAPAQRGATGDRGALPRPE